MTGWIPPRFEHSWVEADSMLGDESERFCEHCHQCEENNTAECSVRLRWQLARLVSSFEQTVNANCECGGRPSTDPDVCDACQVWHELRALA